MSVCPEYTAELMLNLFLQVANFILQNEGYGKPVGKESTQCKKKKMLASTLVLERKSTRLHQLN